MRKSILIICFLLPLFGYSQFSQLDSIFSAWKYSPGCAVGVVQNGKPLFTGYYGFANYASKTPIAANTLFNVGSLAKQVTAFCVLKLVKQGKLKLDDKVSQYFTALPAYCADVEVRHLLSHTSGIRDYLSLLGLNGELKDRNYSVRKIFSLLKNQQNLNFRPGEAYSYSNTGFVLLSLIVEKISGSTLNEYASEQVFKPLGLTTMYIKNSHYKPDFTAAGYLKKDSVFKEEQDNTFLTGDNNIYSNLEDWIKWCNFLFHTPGEEQSQMLVPFMLNDGSYSPQGFGVFADTYRGEPVYGHGGSTTGFSAQMIHLKNKKVTLIILSNLDAKSTGGSPTLLINGITRFFVPVNFRKTAITNPEGLYLNHHSNEILMFGNKNNALTYNNQALLKLSDSLYSTNSQLNDFLFSANRVKHQQLGYFSSTYTKLIPEAPGDIKEHEGLYKSREVRLRLKIEIKDGQPFIKMKRSSRNLLKNFIVGRKAIPAQYVSRDMLYVPLGRMTLFFTRTGEKITGLSLNGQRLVGVRFRK